MTGFEPQASRATRGRFTLKTAQLITSLNDNNADQENVIRTKVRGTMVRAQPLDLRFEKNERQRKKKIGGKKLLLRSKNPIKTCPNIFRFMFFRNGWENLARTFFQGK